ncbi:MAG: Tad domain-containing protein [Pseudomonadota bacterium]
MSTIKTDQSKQAKGALHDKIAQFARDESGMMTMFGVMMFMMMLLVGGIGVDLMRNEMERVRLQNTVDRAVLAAADLDQTLDPETVVSDYFEKSGMAGYVNSVVVDEGLNYRIVTANASTTSPTQFMRIMGVDELPVPAISTAEERIQNVEISLVLDISGSMRDNTKITNLRQAATVFVDTVIRPETQDLISLSLVPYSEHVNAGPNLFSQFNTVHRHNYSHCLEIPASEFDNTNFNFGITYQQMQHYQWNYSDTNGRTDTVCPRYDYERIAPLSQNATALKAQIAKLKPRAGTSIFLGMKWGVGLLDPSMRQVVTNLSAANVIDASFVGRPRDYSDVETLKTIVLMTDGKNDRSHRIASWAYDSPSDYAHWNSWNFWYFMYAYVNWWDREDYYDYEYYTAATGDVYLDQICDAAKAQGIVIWSVGFEVDDHGATQMKNCASSASHFFRVEGVEITEAFRAIARTINQLRLTQ